MTPIAAALAVLVGLGLALLAAQALAAEIKVG